MGLFPIHNPHLSSESSNIECSDLEGNPGRGDIWFETWYKLGLWKPEERITCKEKGKGEDLNEAGMEFAFFEQLKEDLESEG